jgi:hypothetical protein
VLQYDLKVSALFELSQEQMKQEKQEKQVRFCGRGLLLV